MLSQLFMARGRTMKVSLLMDSVDDASGAQASALAQEITLSLLSIGTVVVQGCRQGVRMSIGDFISIATWEV